MQFISNGELFKLCSCYADFLCIYISCPQWQINVPQLVSNSPLWWVSGPCSFYCDAVLWMEDTIHTHWTRVTVYTGEWITLLLWSSEVNHASSFQASSISGCISFSSEHLYRKLSSIQHRKFIRGSWYNFCVFYSCLILIGMIRCTIFTVGRRCSYHHTQYKPKVSSLLPV